MNLKAKALESVWGSTNSILLGFPFLIQPFIVLFTQSFHMNEVEEKATRPPLTRTLMAFNLQPSLLWIWPSYQCNVLSSAGAGVINNFLFPFSDT